MLAIRKGMMVIVARFLRRDDVLLVLYETVARKRRVM